MKVVKDIQEMKECIKVAKSRGQTIGFVPTMGFLHEGHLSLVRESLRRTDATVVSIFVNPTQFGPGEDFKEYPRDEERDTAVLEKEGVDFLFIPDARAMYPEEYKTYVEVHDLQERLCGRSRPGHFRGVCTVVLKLFHIVSPDLAFFGQKDAQQAVILKRMALDLNLDCGIVVLPIIRDSDGLALSSRNAYLTPEERESALSLKRSLREAERLIEDGVRDSSSIIRRIEEIIRSEPLTRIDYIEIVDLDSLSPLPTVKGEAMIALAVYIGKIRLIDNTIIHLKE